MQKNKALVICDLQSYWVQAAPVETGRRMLNHLLIGGLS